MSRKNTRHTKQFKSDPVSSRICVQILHILRHSERAASAELLPAKRMKQGMQRREL